MKKSMPLHARQTVSIQFDDKNRLIIDGRTIEFRWIRDKRRKTTSKFYYHPDGILTVTSPVDATRQSIQDHVVLNESWLRRQMLKFEMDRPITFPTKYESGTTLYLYGQPITLEVREGRNLKIALKSSRLRIEAAEDYSIKRVFHAWIESIAVREFTNRIARLHRATQFTTQLPPWDHRYMTSRWGSCNARGKLRFNTHLIKVPVEAIDFIILHELCHLEVPNHGASFYELMDLHMPDWLKREQELKRYVSLLHEPLD